MMLAILASSLLVQSQALFAWPSYDYVYYTSDYETAPSPRWSATRDAYELKVRLPDFDPDSLTAHLASDGTKIEVVGERKIDGCSCSPSTVKEIALPYRPRAEDIDVSYDKDNVLSLKLARHAKTESATPLSVSVAVSK